MPKRWFPGVGVVLVAVAALVVATRPDDADRSGAARVERVTEALRCPTCQGLSVADSPASTARAISDDVARRVAEGESDGEIKQAYVDRYGEWILLAPRSSGLAALVWALPAAGLAAGAAGLVLAFGRRRREPTLGASDADRALVERAMVERRSGNRP